ncbi:hypothetical protein [Nitrosopumilus sp. b2]|uniref:hypothetical protein n=1 Tax=Nitrosopumilus sp. b2 TaxID=2109908 RepID=UPI0015F61A8A|nr:hypothetical protein [Nitrosopumilus sp. b2]KAF6245777.1 hypothetical protein C6989_01175 [Nitrosopumilus sp. b2]
MLRILVINEVGPHVKNRISILFEQIVPILSKKNKIEVFWLISDKFSKKEVINFPCEILFWKDFRTAKEVIEKTNPSLIFLMPGQSTIDYSFLLTARFFKILTCGWVEGTPMFTYIQNPKKRLKYLIKKSAEKKQIKDDKSSFKSIDYIRKNLFFIRSARALRISCKNIISDLYQQFLGTFFLKVNEIKSRGKFNCNLLLIENEFSIEYGIKNGLLKDSMVMVGDPNYDLAFLKSKNSEPETIRKPNVLFITVNLANQAQSNWSIDNQNKMLDELSVEYEKLRDNFSLNMKIHPVSDDFNQYKKILDKHNSHIKLFQHENIYELIEKADVILTTATSTAGSIALIMNKPLIILNYFNVENDLFLNSKVAIDCNNISKIKECVNDANLFNEKNKTEIKKFIKKYYGEGNAIQKIVNAIENLVKSKGIS